MATLSVAARNAALDAIVTLLTNSGVIQHQLSNGGGILTGPTFVAWGTAGGGSVAVSSSFALVQGTNTGVADTFTLANLGDGALSVSCTVGGQGSGADIELSPNANIITNIRVVLNSLTMSIA
jgi:hypothetical protein